MFLKQISGFKNFPRFFRIRNISQRSTTKNKNIRTTLTKPETANFSCPDFQAKKAEVLSRTKIVTDEKESSKIVRSILSQGEPVAVDLEGVTLPVLGLVQLKTHDGLIYLFRTGRNKKLFIEGGLKYLFEDQNLLKVMHASSSDCGSIYKEGIRMWGLFDTALAYKVIQYQTKGTTTLKPMTSFNDLCEAYGFPLNPLKDYNDGKTFQRENAFLDHADLSEELVYYSACDVEPLLELYQVTSSIISPDFYPLLQELCEHELLRCVDPELVKTRRLIRKWEENATVMLTDVEDGATKAPIYELLANHEGNKKVYSSVSSKTAHITLPNRQSAIQVFKTFSDKEVLRKKIGPDAKAFLLNPVRPFEVEAAQMEAEKSRERMKEENYILDSDKAKEIFRILERVKCPVAVDFNVVNNSASIEMFVGKYPTIKFDVNLETVTRFGIGELVASKEVPKIVTQIDDIGVQTVLRTCSAKDFRPNNFFDISLGYKLVDYILYGSSIFKAPTPTPKEIGQRLGIFSSSHFERSLYIYQHLKNFLPHELINFFGAKSRIDLDLGSNLFVSEAKEARKQLRLRYETHAVHIRTKQKSTLLQPISLRKTESMLADFLKKFLQENNLEHDLMIVLGDRAIVSIAYHPDIQILISALNSRRSINASFDIFASKVDTKTGPREQPPTVNVVDLERDNLSNLDNLTDLGFFKLQDPFQSSITDLFDSNDRTNKSRVEPMKKKLLVDPSRRHSSMSSFADFNNNTQKKGKLTFSDFKILEDD